MKSARSHFQVKKEHPRAKKINFAQIQSNKQNVAYSIFPVENLNSQVTAHQKCTNLYSTNFKTLAYEKFVSGK